MSSRSSVPSVAPITMQPPQIILLSSRVMGLGCLGFVVLGFLWLAGNDGMEKKVRTTIMCYIGTNLRIHSSSPSLPKVSTTQITSEASNVLSFP